MDVKMPAGGGMSAYDNLRHSALTSATPVIFITAYATSELVKKVESGFAVDYLAKPFKMAELLTKIRHMLQEA
jgi:DNA-binding response OmpR family regulator